MIYEIDRTHYHTFGLIELNKLPPRAYFIPFTNREAADSVSLLDKRYSSSKVRCLNGDWDFIYYEKPAQLPSIFDTDAVEFSSLDVPSCWQFRGYGKPFYVNTRYQFPYDPPSIPQEDPVAKTFCIAGSDYGIKPRWQTPVDEYNSVGVYRKKIQIEDPQKQRIISFLGVASCLDLYINGSFVGYSEGSHNTAEFDITKYLTEGENEILAVVRRWCTGTYLECQDMFRNNGIFRDVLLYELEQSDFYDISFQTFHKENGFCAEIEGILTGDATLKVTLSGHGFTVSKEVNSQDNKFFLEFEDLNVILWNAEKPVLYDLYLEIPGSCVKTCVGFKYVKIQRDIFTLNGSKLKLHGVNHHDTSPENGYYLSPQEILRDIRLCKAYNIDTIRTSHYPPDPLLLELCSEYGIYLVDEADIETHGTFTMQLPPSYNSISHNPKWEAYFLDRVQRMYGRDKLNTCIILWSLGNEAGGYRNTDTAYNWLKQQTQIPVHYESVVHSSRVAYDIASEMYPSVEKVRLAGQHKRHRKQLNDRPYFMCEYAHAMGVGPGDIEEYWKEIYQYDNLMGGCVWEMVDHAVIQPNGGYTYGGDHGEWEHDGNFCVDGIFYPDRTPSTGAKIVAHAYRPLHVRHVDGCRYEFFNTKAFTNADEFRISFIFEDGNISDMQLKLSPLCRTVILLPECEPKGRWVNVQVCSREGDLLSVEQILFDYSAVKDVQVLHGLPMGLDIENHAICFRKGDRVLRVSDPHTILYRAPTDNDRDFAMNTAMDGFVDQQIQVLRTAVQKSKILIESKIICRKHVFLCTDTYESCEEGVLVTSKLQCLKGSGNLPRFGKAFYLDRSFNTVQYVGRKGESYCDMKEHTQIDKVTCRVTDMVEPNIRPQESGNRCDCTFVKITDGETDFSVTAVDKPFELGIKPYSDRELLTMKHRQDEVRTGTYLTISAFQMGIGTGSCGPATRPEYCYPARDTHILKFILA